MANTIPVTQKPVPSSVSKDAYVLGIQDNGSGQQALYRLPINDVRGNGANDLFIIPSLITQLGVTSALKAFVEANADYDSLTNICNRFFTAAAKSVSGTYASQFTNMQAATRLLAKNRTQMRILPAPRPQRRWRARTITKRSRCLRALMSIIPLTAQPLSLLSLPSRVFTAAFPPHLQTPLWALCR